MNDRQSSSDQSIALLASFSVFPVEIITEIIIQSQYLPVPLPPIFSRFPWNFRRVSPQWREIIDGTSTIWTSLEFHLGDATPPLHPLQVSDGYAIPLPSTAIPIYTGSLGSQRFALSRGLDRPIRLALKFGNDFANVSPAKIHALLPIILAHRGRIQDITFEGPPTVFQYLPSLANNTFPILQSFRVLDDPWPIYNNNITRAVLSEIAPRLSHINLPFDIPFPQLNADFPTHSLTTLLLPNTRLSSEQILKILSSRPHLARLAITSYDDPLDATPLVMVPPLSSLVQVQSLWLTGSNLDGCPTWSFPL